MSFYNISHEIQQTLSKFPNVLANGFFKSFTIKILVIKHTDSEVIMPVIFTIPYSTDAALDIRYWKGYRIIFFSRFLRLTTGFM